MYEYTSNSDHLQVPVCMPFELGFKTACIHNVYVYSREVWYLLTMRLVKLDY